MKLKNAVVGLQVYVKTDSDYLYSAPRPRGQVGIIVETDCINSGIGSYELMVQFPNDSKYYMDAYDVRKATADDAGFV